MTATLTVLGNSFHRTEAHTRYTRDELEAIVHRIHSGDATPSERALVRRLWKTLCGIEGCTCCNSWGER